ncbi:DRTGG domain-containing protein [Niallia sp. Krafla_26]|uniref:DRTGG domain-containing protein n=1 Tax=Niallia sp. Krafla_26 TaxID=3064703 RepID=UPI003D185CAE
MATKHEQILNYINDLPVGEKISVRQIAKALEVSEGTAYRAIKEAENKGFVSTIERVGTIRIEKKKKENIEKLTFAEVVNIVDGQVLGGRTGLHKTLNKFVIGAMQLDAMMRYIDAGSLLIVGNRSDAHELALTAGAAVLITGGFDANEQVKKLADELDMPVISTSYDTFTTATMINRAIDDQLIKKDILLVEDVLTPLDKSYYLQTNNTLSDWYELNKETGHSRFPVVDQNLKVQGMITSKDIIGVERSISIEKIMTKNPMTVNKNTSVASTAHMMVWESIEILPVVNESNRLEGLISRQDVLKALQVNQRQPQAGETIDDIITNNIGLMKGKTKSDDIFRFEVSPQMTNHLGTISYGVFTSIVYEAANQALKAHKKGDLVLESITIYFLKPVQIDSIVEIHPKVLEVGRKFGKIDIEVYNEGLLVGKALMMCQHIDR